MSHTVTDLKLRDLPFAARLVLAVFLVSVGIGYFAALVQMHFQHASPGNLLPTGADAARIFNGGPRGPSKLEALLVADEEAKFNGSGQMRSAFHKRSDGWKDAVKERAATLVGKRRGTPTDEEKARAESELRRERDGERQALLEWLRAGANQQAFDEDSFCPQQEAAHDPITPEYLVTEDDKPVEPRRVKIASLIKDRCVSCHTRGEARDASAAQFPLDTWADMKKYLKTGEGSGMSLEKLAQTTHVHLLSFSMLYGLTGLILAFSSYPGWLRTVLCPLPLVAQVIDISCWWLARRDPAFAQVIVVTGALVAAGLGLHIVLGLFDLFGRWGKLLLVALIVAVAAGGYLGKGQIIDPFLAREKAAATAKDE